MELGHVQVLPLRRRHIARLRVAAFLLTVGSHATPVIGWCRPGAGYGRARSRGPSAAVVAGSGRGLRCGSARADALPVETLGPAAEVFYVRIAGVLPLDQWVLSPGKQAGAGSSGTTKECAQTEGAEHVDWFRC